MKVEIWSDINCPFCYMGKRNMEKALAQFPQREEVEIIWKSFELDPNAEVDPKEDLYERLASKYGKTREWAEESSQNVTERAAALGLKYDLDRAIPTNSLDAHRLIHFAAQHGLQDEAKERLLAAYFTEGKHIGKHDTLKQIAAEIGLDAAVASKMLASDAFKEEVRKDERDAQQLGIRGVPFFVLNRKYGISGAQPSEVLLQALQQTWEEDNPLVDITNKSSETQDGCGDGSCEV
jgi:predicted DsbA family dithiol-disulfide isomerase